jgi:hypothetical protein
MEATLIATARDYEDVARSLRAHARRSVFTGRWTPFDRAYVDECRVVHVPTGASVIFTRDTGMHSSGWWKNPDYERCEHLSVALADRQLLAQAAVRLNEPPGELDKASKVAWVRAFFPDTTRLVWAEPPFTPEGRKYDVWHYRVFYAEDWRTPILPRGEVYTREFTERGWKSASEVLALEEAAQEGS